MSDFNSLVQYTVENISRPVKYIIYKLTEFIRVVDKFVFRQVPTGAASGYANIEKVEGNTVAWNQLLKQGKLVDMGLPSGLLWATCNIDITQEDGFAASPFQYGCTMFSWGNIEGHNTPASGTTFDYNWGSVNAQAPYYEGQPYGSTPGSTLTANIVAGDTYDSARYNLGSLFKMPTSAQFKELFDNCDFVQSDGITVIDASVTDKRVTVNGIVGIYLKSKVNGNLIFFSASGNCSGTSWYVRGSWGYYWSASFYTARNARFLIFYSGGVAPQSSDSRHNGVAVRAVVNPNTIDTGHNNYKYYVTKDINHDLTAIFGSGNEPTTVADFEAWREQNGLPSIADYNAGELLSVKMSGMQTEDSSQQVVDTIALDVTTITGINTSTNVREVIFPNGMKQADYAGTVKDEIGLVNGTATVNVGSRAYQAGDESDPDVLTDGTTTYYALTTPIVYTDLQDQYGNPLNPRYKVEQGGTEAILPANTSTPTTVAPTLTTTYTKANN